MLPTEMKGKRFGLLTVVLRAENQPPSRMARWKCVCDCGEETIVRGSHLRSGRILSCGCYRIGLHTIHGGAVRGEEYPEYHVWNGMRDRCGNPNNAYYHCYGGRGIKVCERWLNSFKNFIEDMGRRPFGLTLERRNNDGDYEPENCKWATWKEQNNNHRKANQFGACQ